MIVLLTYEVPHRKTQDVSLRLMASGYEFMAVAVPWIERKPRRFIYAHRPHEMMWPCDPLKDNIEFFRNIEVDYTVVPHDSLHMWLEGARPSVVVVGGAGILPAEIVNDFKVLNVHPGFLPKCRGLDILKWSIIEGLKVGVTAHLCDDRPDLGWFISERAVPVYHQDTFHSFAMRQYEMELGLLDESVGLARESEKHVFKRIEPGDTVSRRRMPRRLEADLLPAFERYKLLYARSAL